MTRVLRCAIEELGRQRQEDKEFKVILGYCKFKANLRYLDCSLSQEGKRLKTKGKY